MLKIDIILNCFVIQRFIWPISLINLDNFLYLCILKIYICSFNYQVDSICKSVYKFIAHKAYLFLNTSNLLRQNLKLSMIIAHLSNVIFINDMLAQYLIGCQDLPNDLVSILISSNLFNLQHVTWITHSLLLNNLGQQLILSNFILSFCVLLVIWNIDLFKCISVIHSLVNLQLLQFFLQLVQFVLKFDFVHVSVVVIDLHDGVVDDSVVVVRDHLLFVLNDFDKDLIGGLNRSWFLNCWNFKRELGV